MITLTFITNTKTSQCSLSREISTALVFILKRISAQSLAELHWTEHRIVFSFFHSLSFNFSTAITIRGHHLMLNYKGTLVGLPITAALMPKLFKVMNVLHWIPNTLIIILPFIESVANLPLILKKPHIFIHLKIKSCAHEIYTKALSCGSKRMLPRAHLICFLWSSLCCPEGHTHSGDEHETCIANSLPPSPHHSTQWYRTYHNKILFFFVCSTHTAEVLLCEQSPTTQAQFTRNLAFKRLSSWQWLTCLAENIIYLEDFLKAPYLRITSHPIQWTSELSLKCLKKGQKAALLQKPATCTQLVSQEKFMHRIIFLSFLSIRKNILLLSALNIYHWDENFC